MVAVLHGAHTAICVVGRTTVGPSVSVVVPFDLFRGPLECTGRMEVRLSRWVPNGTPDVAASNCGVGGLGCDLPSLSQLMTFGAHPSAFPF